MVFEQSKARFQTELNRANYCDERRTGRARWREMRRVARMKHKGRARANIRRRPGRAPKHHGWTEP